ncbi:MAG: FAD-dependent oxidoreductase [Myxococcales bacterium]
MRFMAPEKLPDLGGRLTRVATPTRAVVVGGGLAGVSAALSLAERGVTTTLLEAGGVLGGRVSAWDDQLATGERFQMGRGFHAFFRQYYNLRNLLKRLDPELHMLTPMTDYPVHGRGGAVQTFVGIPNQPPFNLIELTRRTPYLKLRDLLRVNVREALAMVAYDGATTYARYDHLSARDYLDSLRFPPQARAMLFNVFAHSFFNAEEEMSAAELLMMFHFYFTGSGEGLVFDVLNQPFSTGLWQPLARELAALRVDVRTHAEVLRVSPRGAGYVVECAGEQLETDQLVLALSVPALKALVERSPELSHAGFRRSVQSLETTRPFVVWRRWIDRRARAERHGFVGTNELGHIDNISLFERFEDQSHDWAERHGGSVVEIHAYAVEPDFEESALRDELWQATLALYPEFAGARVFDERWLVREDCPAFAPGSHAQRPTPNTPLRGLTLAGDFVKLPMPSALMERATAAGMLAANHLLAERDVIGSPVFSVPRRGLLALGHLPSWPSRGAAMNPAREPLPGVNP